MNRLFSLYLIFVLVASSCKTDQNWQIADTPLLTEWALQIDPAKPWNQYPRPGMKRKEWMNLNGLWDYAITSKETHFPESWDGKILVPYPVESALSGVKRRVSEKEVVWYKTEFTTPSRWKGKLLILNFEASDWETTVWVNGAKAGVHRGGYDPFSFDITNFATNGRNIEVIVSVWDPTDKGRQPRGKQVSNPGGIWYTPSSGIWQTVWIEPVEPMHIESFRIFTSVDENRISIKPEISVDSLAMIRFTVSYKGKNIGSVTKPFDEMLTVEIENPVLWTPDNPSLYDLKLELIVNESVTDIISSAAGIRNITLGKTEDGFTRILLNNEFLFQNGTLDQGFWPDGLYTPPSEEAMIYDLWMLKKMGFNMLRKHVKVENRLFYHWCDRIGLLVWQDMPNGDSHISGRMPDIAKKSDDDLQFRYELQRMIETKFNHPSIIMWVPFNEGWGQFSTGEITDFIKEIDPTRLVNSASGWTDRGTGDILDIHNYPEPRVPEQHQARAIVLGEFGGLGLPVENHTWEERNWGYRNVSDKEDLLEIYEGYYTTIHDYVRNNGLSAVVYTQTTDVETETNGLLTYDRKVDKMGADNISKAHYGFTPPLIINESAIFIDSFKLELGCYDSTAVIKYTTDGREPASLSHTYNEPVILTETTEILARAWYKEGMSSRTVIFNVNKVVPVHPVTDTGKLFPGLNLYTYEGRFDNLPDFPELKPGKEYVTDSISRSIHGKETLFAMLYEGYIEIPQEGIYSFYLSSDDGSRLIINNELVIDNDGIHGMIEKIGHIALGKGLHSFKIEYFQRTGGSGLSISLKQPSGVKSAIPPDWLYHEMMNYSSIVR